MNHQDRSSTVDAEWFLMHAAPDPDLDNLGRAPAPAFAELSDQDFERLYAGSFLCRTARLENTDIGCGEKLVRVPPQGVRRPGRFRALRRRRQAARQGLRRPRG